MRFLPAILLFSIFLPSPLRAGEGVDPEELYLGNCAICHGRKGGGDGPKSAEISPKPANFRDAEKMKGIKDEDIIKTIKEGEGLMPAWGTFLSEEEIRALAGYIRGLSKE